MRKACGIYSKNNKRDDLQSALHNVCMCKCACVVGLEVLFMISNNTWTSQLQTMHIQHHMTHITHNITMQNYMMLTVHTVYQVSQHSNSCTHHINSISSIYYIYFTTFCITRQSQVATINACIICAGCCSVQCSCASVAPRVCFCIVQEAMLCGWGYTLHTLHQTQCVLD